MLLEKARQGNRAAKKRLFLIYNPAIVKTTFHHVSTKHQTIPMLEVANLAFFKAIESYKLNSKSQFLTYAVLCIRKAIKKKQRS